MEYFSIGGNVLSQFDDARAERDYRMNPPDLAPGQGGSGWGDDMSFEQPGGMNDFGGGDLNIGSILNDDGDPISGMQGMGVGNVQQQTQQQQPKSTDEQFAELGLKAGKGFIAFMKAFVESIRNNTKGDWHNLGDRMFRLSMIVCAVGMFFVILGPFIPSIKQPSDMILGGLLSGLVGVFLLMFNDKDKGLKGEKELEPVPEENSSMDMGEDLSSLFDDEEDEFQYDEENEEDSIDDSIWDSFNDFEEEPEIIEVDNTNRAGSDTFNVDEALSSVREIPAGTQTRQYLFETFSGIMPNITPNFSIMEDISEESDEFMIYSEFLRSAAYQVGTKEENIPELTGVKKNIFIVQLRATRPAGLKEQEIANEVADQFSRDEDNNVVKYGVYATVDSAVGELIINIFTGESAMVSLNDVYGVISDYVLNPKNTMPFVWGVNELGKPLYCDLINCDSIIISGEARSGKSWKGQSILAQLCMYNSPKEIEIYIFDHKGNASDYKYMSSVLPHIRYFCGIADKINPGIQAVLDRALKERGQLLADAGCINIKDYNRKHPDDKLPYMYIVIDELMSLMDAYDKDQQADFRKLLSTMVSKLPYLGIRLILFPHRIVDSVIGKNTYSLVSSRAVVRQLNADEVKNAVNVTKKEFPYNLVNNGDMALKTKEIANGQTVFCHAEVLTPTNEGNKDLFKFIGSVWSKLMPECKCITFDGLIGGSVSGKVNRGNTRRSQGNPAPDNTQRSGGYQYGSSIEETAEDLIDLGDSNADESFWDDLLK